MQSTDKRVSNNSMRGISYSGAKNEMFLAARTDPPSYREMTIQGLVIFGYFSLGQ